MTENKAPKNLQLRPDDELLAKFTAGRRLVGIDTEAKMLEYCIEFTLKHMVEHPEEFIAERRREHEEALQNLELAVEEVRGILAN